MSVPRKDGGHHFYRQTSLLSEMFYHFHYRH